MKNRSFRSTICEFFFCDPQFRPSIFEILVLLATFTLVSLFGKITEVYKVYPKKKKFTLKMLKNNSAQLATLKEVRRAALACLLDGVLILFNMFYITFLSLFVEHFSSSNFCLSLFITMLISLDVVYSITEIV